MNRLFVLFDVFLGALITITIRIFYGEIGRYREREG